MHIINSKNTKTLRGFRVNLHLSPTKTAQSQDVPVYKGATVKHNSGKSKCKCE